MSCIRGYYRSVKSIAGQPSSLAGRGTCLHTNMPLCCMYCSAAFETHNTIFYLHRILELSASLPPELRLPGRQTVQSDWIYMSDAFGRVCSTGLDLWLTFGGILFDSPRDEHHPGNNPVGAGHAALCVPGQAAAVCPRADGLPWRAWLLRELREHEQRCRGCAARRCTTTA